MQHVPVRKLFWDALTLALETQTHRLARDVAAVLGQPDAPLLKALRDDKVSAYLIEEAADEEVDDLESFRCQHFCQVGGVLLPCRQPVLWCLDVKPRVCPAHALAPSPKEAFAGLLVLKPIAAEETTYYVDPVGLAYTAEGVPCGRYEEGVLTLFREGS